MPLILNSKMAEVVDRLGWVNAQIAELKAQADDLKAELIADNNGQGGEYAGMKYRAVVSVRESMKVDWKKIAEKLEPSRQLIAANSRPAVAMVVSLYDL